MKKIKFEYQRGFAQHDKIVEIVKFDDDAEDKEIEECFIEWAWQFIADKVYWEEVE